MRVEYATVDSLFSEFSRNVNEGGIFIETDSPLEMDEKVQLSFQLPGSDSPIRVTGRVAWIADDPTNPGMGIEFDDLDAEARAHIDELIRRLRAT